MRYENNRHFNNAKIVECEILVKPKESMEDWPAQVERSITSTNFSVNDGFDKIQLKAIRFAKNYIKEKNETIWNNNAIFSGILFRFPNGMVKRYDHR